MKSIMKDIKTLSLNDIYIILLIVSSFISVYLLTFLLFIMPFYALITKQSKDLLPKNKYYYFFLIFAVLASISTFLFAADSFLYGAKLYAWYWKALSILIIILSFDIFFISNKISKKILNYSVVTSLVMSVFSFLIALIQKIFELYASQNRPGRFASTYSNENYYGMAIEFVCIFAIYYIFKNNSMKKHIFGILIITFNVLGLWLCQCRTAYITLSIVVLLMFALKNRKIFIIFAGLFAVLVIIILKYPAVLPRFDTAIEYLHYRFGIWNAAMQAFCDNLLFGRGYFSYSSVCAQYCEDVMYYALHCHNMYIELLLNFGIIGTIPLIIFTVISIKKSISNAIKNDKNDLILIISVIFAVIIHGLADATIFWPQTGIFAAYTVFFPKVYESEKIH